MADKLKRGRAGPLCAVSYFLGREWNAAMTDSELKQLCCEWQGLLGLAHWTIDVQVVRGVEIGGNRGQTDYYPVGEAALVRLKDPIDYHGYFQCDHEETLVHELLHLVFDKTATEEDAYEQVLDRMARVMLKLKRRTNTELNDNDADISPSP